MQNIWRCAKEKINCVCEENLIQVMYTHQVPMALCRHYTRRRSCTLLPMRTCPCSPWSGPASTMAWHCQSAPRRLDSTKTCLLQLLVIISRGWTWIVKLDHSRLTPHSPASKGCNNRKKSPTTNIHTQSLEPNSHFLFHFLIWHSVLNTLQAAINTNLESAFSY